ncbi:MAG TPA: DUF4404 family protein [Fluviicoccus sp.]|nr:DUF4404 family protein [Fluviicoccus sp.]
MSKQLIGDEIARARSHMQQQPLPVPQHDELTRALADMELHLQLHEAPKTEEFLDTLRALEARIEADHPTLAGVLGNLVRILGNMGV